METKENNTTTNSLMRHTKSQLLDIIFRKDDKEKELRNEIKKITEAKNREKQLYEDSVKNLECKLFDTECDYKNKIHTLKCVIETKNNEIINCERKLTIATYIAVLLMFINLMLLIF